MIPGEIIVEVGELELNAGRATLTSYAAVIAAAISYRLRTSEPHAGSRSTNRNWIGASGPEASAGGLMGTFARGELPPELEKAAFDLAQGATSEIVVTPLGHHVLRVEERRPARPATPEQCQSRVEPSLKRGKADRAVREFVRTVMARAKVNHEAVKAPAAGR